MKIRWWSHTTETNVASYRLRCLQIIGMLRMRGEDAALFRAGADKPDVLVLSKRYDRATVAIAEDLRSAHGTRLVLDLCDNHFHLESPVNPAFEARARDLRNAVSRMDAVITSTAALAEVVHTQCSGFDRIYVVGDAVEPPYVPSYWRRLRHMKTESELRAYSRQWEKSAVPSGGRLVWFGNHGSPNALGGMEDLRRIREVLHELHEKHPLALTVISNSESRFHEVTSGWTIPLQYLPWRRETFSRALAMQDIAVIPVGVNPFTVCKTNNRLATAFVHGLATIADAIPAYRDFVGAVVLDDWLALGHLCADVVWRERLVTNGKAILAKDWTLPKIANDWKEVLQAVYGMERTHGIA